ncbi:msrB [Acanthosepion pharaonis]|uniref:MsrB n=1 Tax=Acanthosepion pharaonis TaxID=158019 RepID=A0A812BGE7_ACAPH|nr:msrB [Sepia pharaonis]
MVCLSFDAPFLQPALGTWHWLLLLLSCTSGALFFLDLVTCRRLKPLNFISIGANENSTLFGTCPVTYSKEELKEKLNPVQYHVTQEKGTERAYSGKYVSWNEEGIFTCIKREMSHLKKTIHMECSAWRSCVQTVVLIWAMYLTMDRYLRNRQACAIVLTLHRWNSKNIQQTNEKLSKMHHNQCSSHRVYIFLSCAPFLSPNSLLLSQPFFPHHHNPHTALELVRYCLVLTPLATTPTTPINPK